MQSKQKKFDDRNREDLYGDENFDVEEGISPLMKFRNQNSERSASCDDQSGRPRVRFFLKKNDCFSLTIYIHYFCRKKEKI